MNFQQLIVSIEVTNIDTEVIKVDLLEIAKKHPKGDLKEVLQKEHPNSTFKIIDLDWSAIKWP